MGSRADKLEAYTRATRGLNVEEIRVPSEKGVVLSGLVVRRGDITTENIPQTILIYFQGQIMLLIRYHGSYSGTGNTGNPLHRLQVFSALLKGSQALTILAVAPRSYWTSTNARPTQRGLTADYTHVLAYAAARYPHTPHIIYGHSLGGAVAACVLARLHHTRAPHICGLILENPFASVPAMVSAIYSQRWLPYHYMGPLVWDTWDALRAISDAPSESVLHRVLGDTMVVLSEHDEVVPVEMGHELFALVCRQREGVSGIRRKVVMRGALHEDAWTQRQWVLDMKQYIQDVQKLSHYSQRPSV